MVVLWLCCGCVVVVLCSVVLCCRCVVLCCVVLFCCCVVFVFVFVFVLCCGRVVLCCCRVVLRCDAASCFLVVTKPAEFVTFRSVLEAQFAPSLQVQIMGFVFVKNVPSCSHPAGWSHTCCAFENKSEHNV